MVRRAAGRDDRELHEPARGERGEGVAVPAPGARTGRRERIDRCELRVEICGEHLVQRVRGADVHPGVAVDLAAEELLAIGAAVAEELTARDILRPVQHERAALPAVDVLRLVEAEAADVADRAERATAERGADAVRRVLDQAEPARAGERAEAVHLAGDAAVVHGDDRPRPRRDRGLHRIGVDVQRVRPDVDEHGAPTRAHEGVRGGDVREGREHDLVAGRERAEERGHLERRRARRREEHVLHAESLGEEPAAVAREAAVARRVPARDRRGDVLELAADQVRAIERDRPRRRRPCTRNGAVLRIARA